MTRDTYTWVLAGLQWLTAAGIIGFWSTWFRQPHEQPWLPVGYVEHERVFVFADSVLSIVLIVGGILQVTQQSPGHMAMLTTMSPDRHLGASLGLVGAGMLAFLGILDLAYFAQHGMFKREREGVINAGIVGSVLLLSVLLIVRFA